MVDSRIVTNADKGRMIVVLNSDQYREMCLRHLQDPVYEKVTEFGAGRGCVVLDDEEVFNEDFVQMDAGDKLVQLLCKQLTTALLTLSRSRQLEVQERK